MSFVFHLYRTEKSEKWLDALSDPLTSLYTFNSSIALSDLNGDGDSKLIVADLGTGTYQMKLKVTFAISCIHCNVRFTKLIKSK